MGGLPGRQAGLAPPPHCRFLQTIAALGAHWPGFDGGRQSKRPGRAGLRGGRSSATCHSRRVAPDRPMSAWGLT